MTAIAVAPRICWVPPAHRSLGADCIAFWRDAGGELFPWQEQVIEGMLGLDENDRWVTSNDGMCVARQNGKGVIEQAIEVFFAFELGYRVVMHTAHEFATSSEHQLRLEDFIRNCPHLHSKVKEKGGYINANGKESIRLKSGCRIVFKARTGGGGRGYSGDLLVWDEAMKLPNMVVASQKPMLRASKAPHGPKTIYAGSAVDQESMEYGVAFAHIRKRGMENAAGVSYHEWAAPFDDPAKMDDEALRDRSHWYAGNPSMPDLISEETMADEIESIPSNRNIAVELFNVGDWPSTDGADTVISLALWGELYEDFSKPGTSLFLAFDVSPDRAHASIAIASMRNDGNSHIEVVDSREGTGWVAARVSELYKRHYPQEVICDDVGPAKSLVHKIQELGVPVRTLNTQEHQQACGIFYDAVEQRTVRHIGQRQLAHAIKGAATRPLGDAWAWSRRSSAADITPLVACTFALWGATTQTGGGIFY